MGLTTKNSGAIIISSELDERWRAKNEKSAMTSDGWDSLKVSYYRMSAHELIIEDVATTFPIGMRLGARKFWLTSYDGPKCVAPGLYELVASFKGLASGKPVIVSYGAAANQQSGENILVSGNIEPKVAVYENGVTASARYVLENVRQAPTSQVGKAKTPPNAPSIGTSHWSFLTQSTYHHPNGWVLMGSSSEPIPGTSVAYVTDDYQYIQKRTP